MRAAGLASGKLDGFWHALGYLNPFMNMKMPFACAFILTVLLNLIFQFQTLGSVFDEMGLTTLRAVTTNLNGTGIRLTQAEADLSPTPPAFEVSPASVGQPVPLFTYISALGIATNYPNSVGAYSSHASGVGARIYGMPAGLATNVAHVDSIDADYYYSNYVGNSSLPNLGDALVNQSFTFGAEPKDITVAQQQQLDSEYDNYAVQNNVLFISAPNNGGAVSPPVTSYDCIGVGAYDAGTNAAYGPTLDNGRCKPDICAPGSDTSTATSYASGMVALLLQAAARGDGGSDSSAAGDMRTLKAVFLNGAVKPADWTNSPASPLHLRYGAGLANVFNSYKQLAGGKHAYSASVKVSTGASHPPGTITSPIGVLSGWDLNTNTSSVTRDSINHYYFNVTNSTPGAVFTATATLVWNRAYNPTYLVSPGAINNLDLFLYNAASGSLIAASTSTVDNVEHIYVPRLPAGQYDLQVWKAGGLNTASTSETYALAFDFVTTRLAAAESGGHVMLSWPIYPGGFGVAVCTNLPGNEWSLLNQLTPTVVGDMNVLTLSPTNAAFFRLQRPGF